MEEIDGIIIDSLRNLHCDIDEDTTSLKHFDAGLTVKAISHCLEAIMPETTFPKSLPPSMSAKLKITSILALQIRDLGFRDDIGYQTILYCNEAEIRRIFMFLVEKLPRDISKIAHVEQTGYVPTLVKEIEKKVRDSLQLMWVPSSILANGYRKKDGLFFHSFGNCRPLQSQTLKIPSVNNCTSEACKQYYVRNVPAVTRQCPPGKLVQSLLFQDSVIKCSDDYLRECFKVATEHKSTTDLLLKTSQAPAVMDVVVKQVECGEETELQGLVGDLKQRKLQWEELEDAVRNCEAEIVQARKAKSEEEENLKNTLSQISLKSKTLTVLSKDENLEKLKNLIEASRSKMVSLTDQWNKIQTPLLEEYNQIQNALSSQDLRHQEEKSKLKKLEETHAALSQDLREKSQLEENLRHKLEQVNKSHNRSGYTRRILEIIANVKKQDQEIQKILKDTKDVQREISSLTGQVDRSFTLADELIFRDAKHDEISRKAYKLLVQLRDDCSSIIKAVADLGAVERECRNLQEQIDSERAKESSVKLERVHRDIQEIRKETESLHQKT